MTILAQTRLTNTMNQEAMGIDSRQHCRKLYSLLLLLFVFSQQKEVNAYLSSSWYNKQQNIKMVVRQKESFFSLSSSSSSSSSTSSSSSSSINPVSQTKERKKKERTLWKVTTVTGKWRTNFLKCQKHYHQYGHLRISSKDVKLKSWLIYQRKLYHSQQLQKDRIEALESIGMNWFSDRKNKAKKSWEQNYHELIQYYQHHGNTNVPYSQPHTSLAQWCHAQKLAFSRGILSEKKYQSLVSIGMIFVLHRNDYIWMDHIQALTLFHQAYGHCNVPQRYIHHPTLGQWVHQLRFNQGQHLTQEQRQQLNQLQFTWDSIPQQNWYQTYLQLKQAILHPNRKNNNKITSTVDDDRTMILLSDTDIIQDYAFFPKQLRSWIRFQQREYPKWNNITTTKATIGTSEENIEWIIRKKELLDEIHFDTWSNRLLEQLENKRKTPSSLSTNDWNALFEQMRQRGIAADAPLAILPPNNKKNQPETFENLSEQDLLDLWNSEEDDDDDYDDNFF